MFKLSSYVIINFFISKEKLGEKYKKQPQARGGVVERDVWSFCS
jgi:hypothetical protein